MAPDEIERHHWALLGILTEHLRAGGPGLPEQRAVPQITAAGHEAVRKLIEEIHDQGYRNGAANTLEWSEAPGAVAAVLDDLCLPDRHALAVEVRVGRVEPPAGETVYGIRPHLPRTLEQDRAAREMDEIKNYVRENWVNPADLLPAGLCGNREDHEPHAVTSGSLAPFWCHADQSRRLPYAAEQRRKAAQ